MPHDHVQKILFLTLQSHQHDPGDQMKIKSDMLYFTFVRRITKFGLKRFKIDFVIEIK